MDTPIIVYGSPVLRKHSTEITEKDNVIKISEILSATLKNVAGIGLAGPQINLLKRVFIINTSPLVEDDITIEKFERVFFNPTIIDKSTEYVTLTEGCLSLPGIYEDVNRPEKVLVRYQDNAFNTIEEELDGINARIFQHEFDHLEGILFIDKINLLKRILLTGRLKKIKRNGNLSIRK